MCMPFHALLFYSQSNFLPACLGHAAAGGSGARVPAMHRGALDGTLGSWLWPGLALLTGSTWGVRQEMEIKETEEQEEAPGVLLCV